MTQHKIHIFGFQNNKMSDNYQILIEKLDGFIKKYYLNKIIKGLILALSIYALWYLILIIAENVGRFSTSFRTVLFFISVCLYGFIFITMLCIPILNLFKIGKIINYKQASKIIGKHFPEISDKLQNTLELKELSEKNNEFNDLIIASINQRTYSLNPIPFVSVINLKNNLKYLKFLVPTALVIIILFAVYPKVFSEATQRIINYDKHYETPAPFQFILLNDSLTVKKGDDFSIKLKLEGKYIPDQVLIQYAGNDFYMEKEAIGIFKYVFKNLNNNVNFIFSAANYSSKEYSVEALPNPIIIDFKISVIPPAYTGVKPQNITNSGDITIPAGSHVNWSFNTANIDDLKIIFDSLEFSAKKDGKVYDVSKQILKSTHYALKLKNKYFNENTGINYQINVIPDLYPIINVRNLTDSSQVSIVYFSGFIDDDYGFSELTFNCKPDKNSDTLIKINVPFSKILTSQEFYYAFDFSSLDVKGSSVSYYFEVGDNDAINGVKRTKSQIMTYSIPSDSDLLDMRDKVNEKTENKIDEAKKLSFQIRKDIENLQKKLINEQISTWERNQIMKQIFDNQTRLENIMNEISKEQNQAQHYNEQFSKNEEIIKKQQEINKLFDQLLDDDMKKMMEELQKLMQQFDKSKFFELAKDMKFSTEEMEKQMDNTLELLKKSEVEERLKSTSEQLKNLAEEHEKLSKQTENKELSKEELQKKQEEHKEKFDKIKNEYQKTLEKNNELKEPMKLEDFKQETKDIQQNFEQTEQDLKNDKNSKASKAQKNNAQKMQEMSEKIDNELAEDSMGQMEENIDNIRQILENLLSFSFEQEDIMLNFKKTNARDPKYKEYLLRQKQSQDNFKIIKDSIEALSGRIVQLAPIVNPEILKIYKNFNSISSAISENRINVIQNSQQTILTSANNLTLFLLEMLNQMQQQKAEMQQQKSGKKCNKCNNPSSGSCSNPGNKPNQSGKMRDMQQSLKKQMQDMIDNMKDGGKKNGNSGQGQEQSKQLAQMLMQQEMLQKMLQELMQSGGNQESTKILNQVNKMMEENIKDIINGNITPQSINRQDQIITRLLQAENSEREREVDNKRKSNEAKDYKLSNPDAAFKEKEKELRFNELLEMSNLKLNSYYKNKYKEYLKQLNN